MNRREYLTTAAVAAGAAVLAEAVAEAQNPAAQVADKGSAIRITGMKSYWVGPAVFIKIDTNQGVSGWGEIKAIDPRVGQLDAGLFFLAYQRDPRTQFVALQQKLAGVDRLNEYIQHVSSALFAIPPGVGDGEWVGQELFS